MALCLGAVLFVFFFFQAEDGIRDLTVTGVQTCALPISYRLEAGWWGEPQADAALAVRDYFVASNAAVGHVWIYRERTPASERLPGMRSEEHTSELQSQSNLVCRLLLEKKKKKIAQTPTPVSHYYGCRRP